MIHEILPVGMLACNCSIIGDEETGEAIVIDPGDEIERVQEVLAQHKLRASTSSPRTRISTMWVASRS